MEKKLNLNNFSLSLSLSERKRGRVCPMKVVQGQNVHWNKEFKLHFNKTESKSLMISPQHSGTKGVWCVSKFLKYSSKLFHIAVAACLHMKMAFPPYDFITVCGTQSKNLLLECSILSGLLYQRFNEKQWNLSIKTTQGRQEKWSS